MIVTERDSLIIWLWQESSKLLYPVIDVESKTFKPTPTIFKVTERDYRGRTVTVPPTPANLLDKYWTEEFVNTIVENSNNYRTKKTKETSLILLETNIRFISIYTTRYLPLPYHNLLHWHLQITQQTRLLDWTWSHAFTPHHQSIRTVPPPFWVPMEQLPSELWNECWRRWN